VFNGIKIKAFRSSPLINKWDVIINKWDVTLPWEIHSVPRYMACGIIMLKTTDIGFFEIVG
jgi:hypothetical protein